MDENNKIFIERFKELMKTYDLKPIDISKIADISKSTISKYLNGATSPKVVTIKKLCDYYNLNYLWLLGYSDEKYTNANVIQNQNLKIVTVPVYSDVGCGCGTFIDDRIIDYDVIDEESYHNGDFYVTARGNSMNKLGITTGTRVYIRKQNYAEDNDIVLACICSEETAVIKRYKTLTDGFMLMSESTENYSPMVFRSKDEIETVAILGVAKSFKVNL